MPSDEPNSLAAFARRAAWRETTLMLRSELLARATLGLAVATSALLATVGALAWTRAEAPLGDEARIAALAVAAAALASSLTIALGRAMAAWPGPLDALLRVEAANGTRARLAAALELEESPAPFARLAVLEAREAAARIDLTRLLPFEAPREATAAPALLVACGALAFLAATTPAPPPRIPLGAAADEPIHRDAETAAVKRAARLLARRAVELAARPGGHDAAAELARAARELEAGSTARAALARLATVRGTLEAGRAPDLGEALDRASAALASARPFSDLARSLGSASPPAVAESGAALARRLREDGLGDEEGTAAWRGAARAAQALAGTPGGQEARKGLDALARSLENGARAPASQQAAGDAAQAATDALARASERAMREDATDRADRALDEARDAAAGKPTTESGANKAVAPGALARSAEPRPPGDGSPRASGGPGEKQAPQAPGGGNARAGERRGTPNRQAGGDGPRVAGKGGSNDTETPSGEAPAAEPGGETASLRGLVGERGASAVLAVEAIARGAASTGAERGALEHYLRTEEEALDRESIPLDRRRLIRRYFEALERAR
jgi:hypothetical protein